MWWCVLKVGRLRTLVLPVPVDGFEVFQKFDQALSLRSVASAFSFFDVFGWRVCVFTISEEIEILVDISKLATFLGGDKVSTVSLLMSRTFVKAAEELLQRSRQ